MSGRCPKCHALVNLGFPHRWSCSDATGVASPDAPRWLCPCRCGKLLDRDGYLALVGKEPPTTRRRPNAWKAKP